MGSLEQLFPLTFKGNSTISNPTGRARCARLSFEYDDHESNRQPRAITPVVWRLSNQQSHRVLGWSSLARGLNQSGWGEHWWKPIRTSEVSTKRHRRCWDTISPRCVLKDQWNDLTSRNILSRHCWSAVSPRSRRSSHWASLRSRWPVIVWVNTRPLLRQAD